MDNVPQISNPLQCTFSEDIKNSPFSELPPVIGKRYKFLHLIGRGSFGLNNLHFENSGLFFVFFFKGVVFLSESLESHTLYAVKVEV